MGIRAIVGADLRKFDKAMSDMQKKMAKTSQSMKSLGKNMTIGVTAPLGLLAGASVKSAAELETLEVAFQSMLGSGEAASKMVKDLTDFTAKTPFQLEGVGKAAKQLLSFGVQGDQVQDRLKFLGDIAAGANVPLSDMAAIFGKTKAKGKAMTEEIYQLADRGIPIISVLADQMGVAEDSISDMASQGKISFDIMQKALRSMSEEGGIFEDQMGKQSNTLAGIFSTLQDNVNIAFGEIGKGIVETFNLKEVMGALITKIAAAAKWFKELSPTSKKLIVMIGGFAAALGPLIAALGFMASTVLPALSAAFTTALGPIGLIITGVAALGVAIYTFWDEIVSAFKGGMAVLNKIGENIVQSFRKVPQLLFKAWTDSLMAMARAASDFGNIVKAAFSGEFATIPDLLKDLGKNILLANPLINAGVKLGKEFGKGTVDAFVDTFSNEMKARSEETETTSEEAGEDAGKAFGKGMATGLAASGFSFTPTEITGGEEATPSLFGDMGAPAQLGGEDVFAGMSTDVFEEATTDLMLYEDAVKSAADAQAKLEENAKAAGAAAGQAMMDFGGKMVDSLELGEDGMEGFTRTMLKGATDILAMALSNAIANAIAGASAGAMGTGPAAPFTLPAFIATGVAAVMSAFAAIPAFARGTAFAPGGMALVGERGPELVNLPRGSKVTPNHQLGGMGGNVTFTIEGDKLRGVLQNTNINSGFMSPTVNFHD